jgi:hypothetical protein
MAFGRSVREFGVAPERRRRWIVDRGDISHAARKYGSGRRAGRSRRNGGAFPSGDDPGWAGFFQADGFPGCRNTSRGG